MKDSILVTWVNLFTHVTRSGGGVALDEGFVLGGGVGGGLGRRVPGTSE